MNNHKQTLIDNIHKLQTNLTAFSSDTNLDTFNNIVYILTDCLRHGGRVYVAGNGGSCADGSHLVGEMVGRLKTSRSPIPAENLGSDSAVLTCIANDFGYDKVFSRQLEAKMTKKDVFLAISTSGNSLNIVEALKSTLGFTTVLVTGKPDGNASLYAGYTLNVGGDNASETQEIYLTIFHSLVKCIEANLFPDLGNA